MRFKISLLFICLVSFAFAQNDKGYFVKDGLFRNHNCPQVHNFQQQADSKTWFVFGENVNVRQDTGLQSPIIGKLKIGEEVTFLLQIHAPERGPYNHHNIWTKIKTPNGDTGFVFNALLTKSALIYDFNGNGKRELIMAGLKFDNDRLVSGIEKSEVKLVENGKVVARQTIDSLNLMPFPHKFEYSHLLIRILKDEKLRDGMLVLEISLGNNFCGTYWTSYFFTFKNSSIKPVFKAHIGFYKDPQFKEVIFPSDPGGKPNKALFVLKRMSMNKDEEVETNMERVLRVIEF